MSDYEFVTSVYFPSDLLCIFHKLNPYFCQSMDNGTVRTIVQLTITIVLSFFITMATTFGLHFARLKKVVPMVIIVYNSAIMSVTGLV